MGKPVGRGAATLQFGRKGSPREEESERKGVTMFVRRLVALIQLLEARGERNGGERGCNRAGALLNLERRKMKEKSGSWLYIQWG